MKQGTLTPLQRAHAGHTQGGGENDLKLALQSSLTLSFGRKMRKKITILGVLLLAPVWLCLIFWALPLGSIGPFVLLTWLVNSIALPVVIILIGKEIKNKRKRLAIVVAAIPTGLMIAYFQFISYMP